RLGCNDAAPTAARRAHTRAPSRPRPKRFGDRRARCVRGRPGLTARRSALADRRYIRSMTWSSRLTQAALVLALSTAAASAAGAARQETGSVVVRLVTDPSPPGVSWSYSGLGAPFQLGIGGTQRVVSGLQ